MVSNLTDLAHLIEQKKEAPISVMLIDMFDPSFDGAVSDPALSAGKFSSDSLLSLVEKMRTKDPELKVIAYTSMLSDTDLTPRHRNTFDAIFPKILLSHPDQHFKELRDFVLNPGAGRFSDVEHSDIAEAVKSGQVTLLSPISSENRLIQFKDKEFKIFAEISRVISDEIMRRILNDPSFMYTVPPRLFEELCATVLSRDGFDVHVTSKSRDGGYDIIAVRKQHFGSSLYLVECKRYSPGNLVGVQLVRQLNGVVGAHAATGGILITTSTFTKPAMDFSVTQNTQFRMNLVDAIRLRKWIEQILPSIPK
jgi:hypothetical protein